MLLGHINLLSFLKTVQDFDEQMTKQCRLTTDIVSGSGLWIDQCLSDCVVRCRLLTQSTTPKFESRYVNFVIDLLTSFYHLLCLSTVEGMAEPKVIAR